MLGSGGSLVADAVSYWPDYDTFDLLNLQVLTMASGDKYFKVSNLQVGSGAASVKLPVPTGKTYRLDMVCNFTVYTGSGNLQLALCDGQGHIKKTLYTGNPSFFRKTFNFVIDGTDDLYFFVFIKGDSAFWWNSAGFVDQSTDTGILNSIKEGFSKLWEWLQGIWDSIKEIPTKIGQFITALGDRIKTFFTDLVNNMRNFFTSLGDRISGFFNDIWEKIKSFFLPHDGYFDEYSAKFNAFIDEHFGFLAQLPDELSLIINTLVNYTPADPPYIDFPTVKVPIPGHEFTLIQGQKYVFTILTQSPYNMLYSAYQGFVWLAYCLMLFNFLKHKYNVIFGGDGSAD